jgi:hypothetical protein
MRDTNQVTLRASSALSPLAQDRIAQIRAEIYDGTCSFPEGATAIGTSERTFERIVKQLSIPVYRTGRTKTVKPVEVRLAMEAEARRQIEERKLAMAPRVVGRPRTAAQAAPARTAGRATKPAHAARDRQETART